MTPEAFNGLYREVCDLIGTAAAPLGDGTEDGSIAFHLTRRGVVADVLYFPSACADHAFVIFDLGAIPPDDPRREAIALKLLDMNFVVPHSNPPALGRNPATGHVTLRCVYPLASATAASLVEEIDQGSALALEWRRGYFMPEDSEVKIPESLRV